MPRDPLQSNTAKRFTVSEQAKVHIGDIHNYGSSIEERDCLRSLWPTGIDCELQKNQNPKRVPGTCLWALEHPNYIQWRDDDTKNLLWISADPGCGKSVLTRCIIDEDLPQVFQNRSSKSVLYYFFKDTSLEQRSATRAISTILHQLFVSQPRLICHALPSYRNFGNALSTSFPKLWSIFTAAATDPLVEDVVCIFDALDECDGQGRQILMNALKDFCLCQYNLFSASSLKFLITSRPYFEIRNSFYELLEKFDNIELAGNDELARIKKEIDLVIRYRVAEIAQKSRLPGQVQDHLREKLLKTENRTYLWLRLIWEIILKDLCGNIPEMNALIDNLPVGIQDSYERLLQRGPNTSFARRVLQIILVASRPLTLDEMDVALMVNEQTLSYIDLGLEGSSRLQATLPSRCGLMISIIQSKVYFIHQTVKEFLLDKVGIGSPAGRTWQQSLSLKKSHDLMAEICLQSMAFSEIQLDRVSLWNALLPEHDREMEPNEYCQSYSLLSYTAIYWAEHYRSSNYSKGMEIIERFLKINNCPSIIGRWKIDYGTTLHAASAGGHDKIVQMLLLHNKADANAQSGTYGNALQAASAEGHHEIVKILLINEASVNVQGGVYGNALQAASVKGHQEIVEMLLEKGANVNAQGGHYDNALRAAEDHQEIVKILLKSEANVNSQGGVYGNALQAASVKDHQEIVKMILEKGANVNAQNGHYGNALQAASANGHQEIMKMLLENEANVNAQGGRYGNALQAASAEGHQESINMLLEKEANVNVQGGHHGNSLQAASANNHQEIVNILLENGANVNAQGGDCENALQAASAKGHQEIMKILLENGASINAQGGFYGNALQAASRAGHSEIVKTLLENGANVNAEGGRYDNALQAASRAGHSEIVKTLLENGANVNAQGGRYGNALQAASTTSRQEIVKILLENGANVNARGGHYSSALQAASKTGRQEIVKILVKNGAIINAQGGFHGNALQAASRADHKEVVNILLEDGARLSTSGEG